MGAITPWVPQELLEITVTAASTSTSVATHGAAPSPTIGGNFTTTAAHPNVDIEIASPFVSATIGSSVPSVHVMIDGVADANCQLEAPVWNVSNGVGAMIYRKVRLTLATPGPHTLSVFLKNSSAGTCTFSATSVNPAYVRVVEAP